MRGSVRHLLKTRTSFANRSNEDMLGKISTCTVKMYSKTVINLL